MNSRYIWWNLCQMHFFNLKPYILTSVTPFTLGHLTSCEMIFILQGKKNAHWPQMEIMNYLGKKSLKKRLSSKTKKSIWYHFGHNGKKLFQNYPYFDDLMSSSQKQPLILFKMCHYFFFFCLFGQNGEGFIFLEFLAKSFYLHFCGLHFKLFLNCFPLKMRNIFELQHNMFISLNRAIWFLILQQNFVFDSLFFTD